MGDKNIRIALEPSCSLPEMPAGPLRRQCGSSQQASRWGVAFTRRCSYTKGALVAIGPAPYILSPAQESERLGAGSAVKPCLGKYKERPSYFCDSGPACLSSEPSPCCLSLLLGLINGIIKSSKDDDYSNFWSTCRSYVIVLRNPLQFLVCLLQLHCHVSTVPVSSC